MGIRRKSREIALQALYQAEMGIPSENDFDKLCANFEVSKKALPYAKIIFEGVIAQKDELDKVILEHAKNWRLDRMSVIDRNLIRLGVYELLYQKEVPGTVAINEAIEIAKRYSADDSPSFINGILDALVKSRASLLDGQQQKEN